ncbi:YdgA family protein [Legionella worsleiensis]|uniref:Putative membrane protein YdgA-like protein n=1 Tax=Legionella worsleiensis TaxID=45076 RepID=A0A0W1AFC1_9GAMM|nr:YdgA family protein [Legionella worsleiensis]KTD80044.1 putative membrane protein YdgA-like protein [Legionella worsleiensis]STY32517.1 putative membrane protein YdgA-like protein [Legionella worsleiensis]
MKKLAGLIIILAVLVLGGYYGMGVLTERTIKNNVEVINQSNGLFADIQQYNRGWFCSDAQIKWRLHVPERVVKDADGKSQTVAAQDYQMDMPLVIHHGPFIFADKSVHFGMGYAKTVFPLPEQYNQQFDEMFSKDSIKPQLDLSIFVNYLNRSTLELFLPSFKLIAKDGNGTFNWMGMESTTTMSANLDKVSGDIILSGMNIAKDDTKMTMGKVTSEFDLHQTPAGLYLGEASFSLPSFDVVVKDQKLFELNEFSLSSSSDIEDGLFSTHFRTELKSVVSNGKTYGPGSLEMSLRNLDAEVLARINQQATTMQNGTEAERQQAMLAMLPELPKLFTKGAEFEISRLSLKLPEGTIDGSMLVSLPKGDSTNPFELIQKIQGNAKLRVPTAVVKQLMQQSIMQQLANQPEMQQALIQQLQGNSSQANATPPTPEQLAVMQTEKQIATIEQSGLITVDGSDYVVEMSLDQGKFLVNGKAFDPSMLKF